MYSVVSLHIFLMHFYSFTFVGLKPLGKALHITIFNQSREFHGDDCVFEVEQEKCPWSIDKKLNPQNGALDVIERG